MVPPGGIRRGRPPMRGGNARRATPESPSNRAGLPPGANPPVAPAKTVAPVEPSTGPASAPGTAAIARSGGKKRVLFVCIGNSCRSQMAEAFARAYGADIIEARSAGLSPATFVAPLTKKMLEERNIPAQDQFTKGLEVLQTEKFDLVINLSGYPLPPLAPRIDTWPVPDPIGQKESVYRDCAARIEALVMRLILELRAN
jgi:arsenate reductase (thioredoxin)